MNAISTAFDEILAFDNQLSNGPMYMLVSHKKDNGEYESCKITLDSIAAQLTAYLSYIKTAARTPSSDFATLNHDHDIYTSATYSNDIAADGTIVMKMTDKSHTHSITVASDNGHENIDVNQEYTMSISAASGHKNIDMYQEIKDYLPNLGTMQMTGIRDLSLYGDKLNPAKLQFTGWVRADGASYSIADFYMSADIPKVFKSYGSSFTVPMLSDFVKINCSTSSGNTSYSTYIGNAALPIHSHEIVMPNNELTIEMNSTNINVDQNKLKQIFKGLLKSDYTTPSFTLNQIPTKLTGSAVKYIHWGLNDSKNYKLKLQSTMTLDNQILPNLGMMNENGQDIGRGDAPYPSHNLIPAIIYIGPSKYSDLNVYLDSNS